ncbi:MAG TPA: SRPBCC family protein [Solirubrobacteraceae bacterium]|jgi:hypothetical protein|nr:SRPBCC family protein [Solirubrobacteraceae bacterium]
MGRVTASASTLVAAPPEQVLELLRDYRDKRPGLLPGSYTAYRVEAGGNGAGTVIAYHFAAGGRERDYRLRVQESDGVIEEHDELSSFVSVWRVEPSGSGSKVTLQGSWEGAGGIGGFFERTFAPGGLSRIYREILNRLAAAL